MGRLTATSAGAEQLVVSNDDCERATTSSTMVTATGSDVSSRDNDTRRDEDPSRTSSPKLSVNRKARKVCESIVGGNRRNSLMSAAASSSSEAYQIRAKLLYRLGIYDTKFQHAVENDSNDPAGVESKITSHTPFFDEYKSPAERRRTRLMNLGGSPAAAVASAHNFSSLVGQGPALSIQSADAASSSPRPWLVPAEGTLTIRVPLKYKADGMKPQAKSRVSFDEAVSVVPIPRRSDYSRRVSSRLWSRADEIRNNAARNVLEFAAEGWDWRTVMEDHQMFVDAVTGDLIHPVHLAQTVAEATPPREMSSTTAPSAEDVQAAGFTPLKQADSLTKQNGHLNSGTRDPSPADVLVTSCAR